MTVDRKQQSASDSLFLQSRMVLAIVALFLLLLPHFSWAADPILGDIDGDGVVTVLDLVKLNNLAEKKQALKPDEEVLADANRDGFVNELDRDLVLAGILQARDPQSLPLATVSQTSPSRGEGGVAVTRESILYFSIPLHPDTVLDTAKLFARFGGKKILCRVELASDRTKATLFMLQPLPSSAEVEVVFDSAGVKDLLDRPVDGDGDGAAGGIFSTSFRTLSIVPVGKTGVVGRVLASERGPGGADIPIEGAIITVDGKEEELRAVTDANGNFTLSPAPAGAFFVHIDGRSAKGSNFPTGDYYPFVGKKWFAEAGREDNPAGDLDDTAEGGGTGVIYLPLVKAGSLVTVSSTNTTAVTAPDGVPGMEGVKLEVPPNALFADDGTRGGRVGIAPVEPDRIPSPLPPGLELPLVITVQTDGPMNFDRPVPVTFPNLPDPVTGETLGPGEKSALWSFNHDTGEWEIVGPATVSEDGKFVSTDAGVGLLQPGWHGVQPGTQIRTPIWTPPPLPHQPIICPNLGFNEYSKLFQEAVSCGSEFSDVIVKMKALLNTIFLAQSAYEMAHGAAQLANTKPLRIEDAKKILDSLKQARETYKDAVKELVKSTSSASGPIALSRKIFNCAGNLLGAISTICGGPLEGRPAECEPTGWKKYACSIASGIKVIHTEIKFYIDLTEKQIANGLSEAAAVLFDALVDRAIAICEGAIAISDDESLKDSKGVKSLKNAAGTAGISQKFTIPEKDRLELVAALTNLEKHLGFIPELVKASENLLYESEQALILNFNLIRTINADFAESALPAIGKTYYLLNYGQWEQRGTILPGNPISAALPPDTYPILIEAYNPKSKSYGFVSFATAANGVPTESPALLLTPMDSASTDADQDGLPDKGEAIVGTDPTKPDTDGDGISDYSELMAGGDPLSGMPMATGVVASLPSGGSVIDVSASDSILAAALGPDGVGIYNVSSPISPMRLTERRTGGHVGSVAVLPRYVAAAAGTQGLVVVPVNGASSPGNPRTIRFNSSASAVATDGNSVFVGLEDGTVATVEPATGLVLGTALVGSPVRDLLFARDELYVRTEAGLKTLGFDGGELTALGSLDFVSVLGAGNRRFRISLHEKALIATDSSGYHVLDAANPAAPAYTGAYRDGQFGWKQMVPNGKDIALALADPNSTADGAHDVSVYSLGNGTMEPFLLTRLETPGLAAAISLYNGLAYVADSNSGVQVLNYLPADRNGQGPQISLESNFNLADRKAEEGKRMRLTALVSDDVQVRNVEFFLNGVRLASDGNSPFETSFTTPTLQEATSFRVNARVFDTGGNMAEAGEIEIELLADATPPTVRQVLPFQDSILPEVAEVLVRFNEPMDTATLSEGVRLHWAGLDRKFDTEDDVDVEYSAEYLDGSNILVIRPESPLAPGKYLVEASSPAADLAGNPMSVEGFTSGFRIYSNLDTDQDGLPDEVEEILGTNPDDEYSHSKKYSWLPKKKDGEYDFDGDSMSNAGELRMGTDPLVRDTNENGIADGWEDRDGDGLVDYREVDEAGTDPFQVDTDGDGLDDNSEVLDGTNALESNGMPIRLLSSRPVSFLHAQVDQPDGGREVFSSVASYLNAAPLVPDASTIGWDVVSLPVSYHNQHEEPAFDDGAINIYSQPVSYLNGLLAGGGADSPGIRPQTVSIHSSPVSYLNTAYPRRMPETLGIYSLPVSYKNEAP